MKLKPLLTFKCTLNKEAKKGFELTPKMKEVAEQAIESGKDIVFYDKDHELYVVRPMHPIVKGGKNFDDFDSDAYYRVPILRRPKRHIRIKEGFKWLKIKTHLQSK